MRQKHSFLVVVFALCCGVAAPGLALDDFKAAGALLVSGDGQSRQVLLVKHHSRSGYEMPGGRRQFASAGEAGKDGVLETAYLLRSPRNAARLLSALERARSEELPALRLEDLEARLEA